MGKKILCTGVFNLDTIVVRDYPDGPGSRHFTEKVILEEVGGTCGNVSTMLSWLGNEVYPVAVFDDTPEGMKLTEGLRRYGCDCRYVRNVPGGGTTTLRCTHKKDSEGNHVCTFRAGSPGGSRFPKRHFLRARDEAPEFLASLGFTPDIFFFDSPAAGHRVMAKALRDKGTIVYFEPSAITTKADLECVELSDIIKFSGENIPDASFTDGFRDKLFIQTLGSEGVRFRLRGGEWITMPPVSNNAAVDGEGAGDWTTTVFMDALLRSGCTRISELSEDLVRGCLLKAQKVASESVSYYGSKGIIHAGKIEKRQQDED